MNSFEIQLSGRILKNFSSHLLFHQYFEVLSLISQLRMRYHQEITAFQPAAHTSRGDCFTTKENYKELLNL